MKAIKTSVRPPPHFFLSLIFSQPLFISFHYWRVGGIRYPQLLSNCSDLRIYPALHLMPYYLYYHPFLHPLAGSNRYLLTRAQKHLQSSNNQLCVFAVSLPLDQRGKSALPPSCQTIKPSTMKVAGVHSRLLPV